MLQTGHRSVQMVRQYIRDGRMFRENSAGDTGAEKVRAGTGVRPLLREETGQTSSCTVPLSDRFTNYLVD